MSYTSNVPQATQTIAATQPLIQDNFGYIQTTQRVEHQWNGGPNGGQADGTHLKCSMPDLSIPPVLPAGTTGMYYVEAGEARFFGNGAISQLTLGLVSQNGYQWIGRMLLQWGFVNSTTSGNQLFSTPFPNAVLNIQTTAYFTGANPNGAAAAAIKFTASATAFDWVFNTNSGAYAGFYWMAIGF